MDRLEAIKMATFVLTLRGPSVPLMSELQQYCDVTLNVGNREADGISNFISCQFCMGSSRVFVTSTIS